MTENTKHTFEISEPGSDVQIFAVTQRENSGYWNATEMCGAYGKTWSRYAQNPKTKVFLQALADELGIELSGKVTDYPLPLIQTQRGGRTWVHKRVAVHLAGWLSTPFALAMNRACTDHFVDKKEFPRAVSAEHLTNEEICAEHLKRMNHADALRDELERLRSQIQNQDREKDARIYNLEEQLLKVSKLFDGVRAHAYRDWKKVVEPAAEAVDRNRLERSRNTNIIQHGLFKKRDNGQE